MGILKKKDLDQQIFTIDGKETIDIDGNPITFRKALVACCGIYQPQANVGMTQMSPSQLGEEAIRSYDLGIRIMKDDEIELTKDDCELLKKIIQTNKIYVAFITAQLYKLIDKLEEKVNSK